MADPFELTIDADSEHPPEKVAIDNLMVAMLERVIRDALGSKYIQQEIKRDARQYVHSKSEEEWSFNWIAQHLALSAKFIKRIRSTVPRSSARLGVLSYNAQIKLLLNGESGSDPSHTLHELHTRPALDCRLTFRKLRHI